MFKHKPQILKKYKNTDNKNANTQIQKKNQTSHPMEHFNVEPQTANIT